MADHKAAKTHTHPSNRAKSKNGSEKKVVFKSVLDNPFRIRWPSVPVNLQNTALAHLVTVLDGLAAYNGARSDANRKRKREVRAAERPRKKKKVEAEGGDVPMTEEIKETAPMADEQAAPSLSVLDPPPVAQHMVFGINEVTKRLEAQASAARTAISPTSITDRPSTLPPLSIVFVCRADVDPPILIDHIPHVVAAINSSRASGSVKVIPLPKGAESTLATVIGVRRVAVVAFDGSAPGLSSFDSILGSIPLLTAPWLKPATSTIVPTHVKQLRTTAPQDMKATKEKRAEGKAAAKQRKKERKGEAMQT